VAEPTKRQRRIRRLRRVCLSALALLLLAVLLYPFWLVPLIRPVASRLGVRIERAEAQGYERIRFDGILWSNKTTAVRIASLEIEAPHRLFVDWLMRAPAGAQPQLVIDGWTVETRPGQAPKAASHGSTSAVLESMREVLPSWQRWVRHARATKGEFRLGDRSIPVPRVLLREGQLDVEAAEAAFVADLARLAGGAATLTASNANVTVELAFNETRGAWAFDGHVLWLSNRFELRGNFAGESVLPASMLVESDTLTLRPETLGLSGFSPLEGYVRVHWTNDVYTFEGSMDGTSRDQGNWLPERIGIRLRGSGDLEMLTVNRFALESPFVDAVLEEPVTVAYGGRLLGERTRLRLQVDLGRIEALPVGGVLAGHIDLEPVIYAPIRATFQVAGSDLDGFGLHADRIDVDGVLTWPNFQLTNVLALLESGAECSAQLDLDLNERRLNQLNWTLAGPWPWAGDERLQVEGVSGSGHAEGVWPAIHHNGHLELTSPRWEGLQADRVLLDWVADRLSAEQLHVQALSGEASVDLTASGSLTNAADTVLAAMHVENLEISSSAQSLRLAAPVDLDFARTEGTLSLELEPVQIEGGGRQLTAAAHIRWPHQGYAGLELSQLDQSLVQPFVQRTLPEVSLDHVQVQAGWTNGPLLFDAATRARWRAPDRAVWTLLAHAESDGETIGITSTELELDGASVATLSGEWPVRVEPALGRECFQAPSESLNSVDLEVRPGIHSLDWLERRTGVRLDQPTVQASITNDYGTVSAGVVARTRRVSLTQTNESGDFVVPSVEDVLITGQADLQSIRLTSAMASSLGQPVSASGSYDIGVATWSDWWTVVGTG